jgi:hypothetical protein
MSQPEPGVPYSDWNTTCGRGNDYTNTCLGNYDRGEDIVYRLTITDSNMDLLITLDPQTSPFTGVRLLNDTCPPDPNSCIATSIAAGAVPHSTACTTVSRGTYQIIVDTWPQPNCIDWFNLTVANCSPVGACCTSDGCQFLTMYRCIDLGGQYMGDGTPCTPNPCQPPVCLGDLNCDGQVDFGDINPFVQYLSSFTNWQAAYPGCNPLNGDINGNGTYGQGAFDDINPFVQLLSSGTLPIECPVP